MTLPRMRRDHYLIATCGLRGCNLRAEWISTDPSRPLKICHHHMLCIDHATVTTEREEKAQRERETSLDFSKLGEIDERDGSFKQPGDEPGSAALPPKGRSSAG